MERLIVLTSLAAKTLVPMKSKEYASFDIVELMEGKVGLVGNLLICFGNVS